MNSFIAGSVCYCPVNITVLTIAALMPQPSVVKCQQS